MPAYSQADTQTNPDWNKYHTAAETHAILKKWAQDYPSLVNLYSIGETIKGTPLMVMEITNKKTGKSLEKPGYYYDGNIHSGELTSAEVILHFAWYVLNNYNKDSRITRLLDTRTLYLRPKFNPDGADLAMTLLHNLRSTPRPYDEDSDGLLDEDPPNDLNDDGIITRMRVKDPEGTWKINPDDKRIMVRRRRNEETGVFYQLYPEGTDEDDDGRFNEDDIGGIDMNRNFPRNWGMEFEQSGAGPFPLSEPETRATIEFINTHRNITGIFHGHTSGGFVYRLPSTTSWDNFNQPDRELILGLSEKYETFTGQPARPSYTDPRRHRHGTLISWGYWDFGVPGFVPEFWGGFGKDYDHDGNVSEMERLRWNEEELQGNGFINWKPYNHPQLGKVEIGGWKSRYTSQNPPPHLLKPVLELNVPWMLWLAGISPRVVIKNITTEPLDEDNKIKIKVIIENEGYLPTYITKRALDAKIAVPVRALVHLKDAILTNGKKRTAIGHLKGSHDSELGTGTTESQKVLEYVVQVSGNNPVFSITIESEKGGTVKKEIKLNSKR